MRALLRRRSGWGCGRRRRRGKIYGAGGLRFPLNGTEPKGKDHEERKRDGRKYPPLRRRSFGLDGGDGAGLRFRGAAGVTGSAVAAIIAGAAVSGRTAVGAGAVIIRIRTDAIRMKVGVIAVVIVIGTGRPVVVASVGIRAAGMGERNEGSAEKQDSKKENHPSHTASPANVKVSIPVAVGMAEGIRVGDIFG